MAAIHPHSSIASRLGARRLHSRPPGGGPDKEVEPKAPWCGSWCELLTTGDREGPWCSQSGAVIPGRSGISRSHSSS